MATASARLVVRYVRELASTHLGETLTDRDLLSRFAQQRDEAAFTALVRRHGPLVLSACRRILNDHHAAEDSFQATFLVLAKKAGSLRQPGALGPWLYGVACRTARKARTKEAQRRAREQQAAAGRPREAPDDLAWRDLRPVLDEAVNGLPEKYRAPFVLHCLQGLTVASVARQLGCPAGTIGARLARARTQLRDRLARRGLTLPAAALTLALPANAAVASLPAPLLSATVRAAVVGRGAISAAVAALAQGGGKAMFLTKAKVAAVLLALSVATGGAVLRGQAGAEEGRASSAVSAPGQAPREVRAEVESPDTAARLFVRLNDAVLVTETLRSPASYARRFDEWLDLLSDHFDVAYANRYDGRIEVRERAKEGPKKIVRALVRVNGAAIYDEDVRAAYLAHAPAGNVAPAELTRRIEKDRNATLRRLVEREVVLQDAFARLPQRPALLRQIAAVGSKEFARRWVRPTLKNTGLKGEEDLEAFLRSRGTSLAAVRRQWQRDFLAGEYLRSRVEPRAREVAQAERKRILGELMRKAVIECGPDE